MSISVNYAPFVDWKNVQRTLAIQNEMLSYAAEPPQGNLLFDYLRCTIYVLFGQFSRLSPYSMFLRYAYAYARVNLPLS